MARTISEIQAEIIAAVQADATLSGQLTSTSATAIWRLWTHIVATAIFALESLFDLFKTEVSEIVAAQKAHTLRWYQTKALNYQHGGNLYPDGDGYDNTGLTSEQIEAQKIIKFAAANEQDGMVVVKVAKTDGVDPTPPSVGELTAITEYFGEIKDAGVIIQVRGVAADRLKVVVDVFYDPIILDSAGARLDGTGASTVQDAAKNYLRNLSFNGRFVKAHLVDALQKVNGVVVPETRLCQARRDDDPSFGNVDVFYQPYSGFMKFYTPSTDLILNFISA